MRETGQNNEAAGPLSVLDLLNNVNDSYCDVDSKNSSAKKKSKDIPQVIYATRTHSQISQGKKSLTEKLNKYCIILEMDLVNPNTAAIKKALKYFKILSFQQ